jgi:hypothetical protein
LRQLDAQTVCNRLMSSLYDGFVTYE